MTAEGVAQWPAPISGPGPEAFQARFASRAPSVVARCCVQQHVTAPICPKPPRSAAASLTTKRTRFSPGLQAQHPGSLPSASCKPQRARDCPKQTRSAPASLPTNRTCFSPGLQAQYVGSLPGASCKPQQEHVVAEVVARWPAPTCTYKPGKGTAAFQSKTAATVPLGYARRAVRPWARSVHAQSPISLHASPDGLLQRCPFRPASGIDREQPSRDCFRSMPPTRVLQGRAQDTNQPGSQCPTLSRVDATSLDQE